MKDFTIGAAIDLFEHGITFAKAEAILPEDVIENKIKHSFLVATAAEIISSKLDHVDTEKAYALGLLHDYGKFIQKEDDNSFHGITGYWAMKRQGWDEAANICITHTFPEVGFVESDYYVYGENNIKEAVDILSKIKYTDYDRLIQLCDLLVNVYVFATIKERMKYIAKKYKANKAIMKRKHKQALDLKKYFDSKCGCNIYDLLGVKE